MNRLQQRRQELGLTQPQVSEMLKAVDPRIDVAMVSRFERGACLPTPDALRALETALQAHRSELYGEDEISVIAQEDGAEAKLSRTTELLAAMIPFGRENAVSRGLLAAQMGVSDRRVRGYIEDARTEGLVIINAQDGRGYFQTDDLNEIAQQYRQDTARAMSILKRRKTMRRMLKAAGREV